MWVENTYYIHMLCQLLYSAIFIFNSTRSFTWNNNCQLYPSSTMDDSHVIYILHVNQPSFNTNGAFTKQWYFWQCIINPQWHFASKLSHKLCCTSTWCLLKKTWSDLSCSSSKVNVNIWRLLKKTANDLSCSSSKVNVNMFISKRGLLHRKCWSQARLRIHRSSWCTSVPPSSPNSVQETYNLPINFFIPLQK